MYNFNYSVIGIINLAYLKRIYLYMLFQYKVVVADKKQYIYTTILYTTIKLNYTLNIPYTDFLNTNIIKL